MVSLSKLANYILTQWRKRERHPGKGAAKLVTEGCRDIEACSKEEDKECGDIEGCRKLVIEEFGPDVVAMILEKLPCTERYQLYSLLHDNELKKTMKNVFSRQLILRYEFITCTVTCEEEGFKRWKVGLYPIVWIDRAYEAWGGTSVTWSSSGGLVAAIVDTIFQRNYERRLAIVVTNVVTGSSRTVKMPCLSQVKDEFNLSKIELQPGQVECSNYHVNIVLDCDPETQTYKIVIAECEWSMKVDQYAEPTRGCDSTIHVYSSRRDEWKKYSKVFMDSKWHSIMKWHAIRSGFLHFSSRGSDDSHVFYTLNMADISSPHTSKKIYHKWKLDSQWLIDILRPAIFSEEYIVAFGSENKDGEIRMFEWDASNGWHIVSSLPMEKVKEFLSNCTCRFTSICQEEYTGIVTFRRGNNVGIMLLSDPGYGLEYDMDSKSWECIFDPALRSFVNVPSAFLSVSS